MKLWMIPVEMISVTTCDGNIKPIKFKWFVEDDAPKIIKIDRIITMKEEKIAGNRMLIYVVESIFNDAERQFELKYELQSMKWYLYKF